MKTHKTTFYFAPKTLASIRQLAEHEGRTIAKEIERLAMARIAELNLEIKTGTYVSIGKSCGPCPSGDLHKAYLFENTKATPGYAMVFEDDLADFYESDPRTMTAKDLTSKKRTYPVG